jgi:predicted Na+-dependent transporter
MSYLSAFGPVSRENLVGQLTWREQIRPAAGGGADSDRRDLSGFASVTELHDVFDRWLLPLVILLAAAGLAWPDPPRSAVDHQGVNVALVVLVAAVGLGLPTTALAQARAEWRRVVAAVALGATVLPALAWLAGLIVPAGPLRLGVLAAGVAPSEVAAVALAALAGGRAAVSAAVLVGSTGVCVVTAGPLLHLLAGPGHSFSSVGLLFSLLRIVAVPLVLGAGLRAGLPARLQSGTDHASAVLSSVAVLVLIWLVAGQAHLDLGYLRAGLALFLYLAASTVLGGLVGRGLPRARGISLVLPVAMRDFAIAAGIAAAAFGAPAAAALGIYGVLVILLGAVAARLTADAARQDA